MLQLTRWERKETDDFAGSRGCGAGLCEAGPTGVSDPGYHEDVTCDFGPVGGETHGYITGSCFATGHEKPNEVARTPERARSGRTPARTAMRKISYPVSRTTLLTETRLPPPEYIPPEGPT